MKTKAPRLPKKGKSTQLYADVVISGAGAPGMILALLLARAGLSCVLIDTQKMSESAPRPSGRTAALLNQSITLLETLGVWADLKGECAPLCAMRIIDDPLKNNRPSADVTFHAMERGLGQFGYNVPNAALLKSLVKEIVKERLVTVIDQDKIQTITPHSHGIGIKTVSGVTIEAKILIGTDGRHSTVRSLSGIGVQEINYHQTAMTCLLAHSKGHQGQSIEFHRSGGPFTLVPMVGNHSSLVWVEKDHDAAKYVAMPRPAFETAIQDRTKGMLGKITLLSAPECWPLISLKADDLIAPRVAIAAEAAHVLSPIGAQGLNLSLRDIAGLAETLIDAARRGEDIGTPSVLYRYRARRLSDITLRVRGIDGLNKLVTTNLFGASFIRYLGLKGLDSIPALKHFAMDYGLSPNIGSSPLL